MSDTPSPKTLRDYARTLRRHLVLIGVVAVVAAAISLALSLGEAKSYSSSATMNFVDPTSEIGILGGVVNGSSPSTLAAEGVARLTRATTLAEVKRDLRSSLSVDQLRSSITATTDATTSLVTLSAKAPTARGAAQLVNAVANQAKADTDAVAGSRFASIARELSSQLARMTPAEKANVANVASIQDDLARARALENGGAIGAEIVSAGQVPSSPSSPQPAGNAVLGGFLGLLVGLVIAGLRESFDRRIRHARDIESELDFPLVGQIRETALGKAALRAGGSPEVEDADLEAFRILRANLEFLSKDARLRLVAVTSALPEEGKTTVAASLALAAATAGRRTMLVECDLRRPMLPQRLDVAQAPGLTDFLSGRAEPHEILKAIRIDRTADSAVGTAGSMNGSANGAHEPDSSAAVLTVITAGSRNPRPAELLASETFVQFLAEVSQVYDLVVLDTPPLLPVADTLELIPNVDAVLMCVRASRTTREQIKSAKAALDRLPAKPTGIVVTGVRDRHDESGYSYPYSYDYSATETEVTSS